jgi:hypothetical protein
VDWLEKILENHGCKFTHSWETAVKPTCVCVCLGVTLTNDAVKMLLRKMNSLEEKMDLVLRKVSRMTNKTGSGGTSATSQDDDGPCLPNGVTLPFDSVRGFAEFDSRLNREPGIKKQLVCFS